MNSLKNMTWITMNGICGIKSIPLGGFGRPAGALGSTFGLLIPGASAPISGRPFGAQNRVGQSAPLGRKTGRIKCPFGAQNRVGQSAPLGHKNRIAHGATLRRFKVAPKSDRLKTK